MWQRKQDDSVSGIEWVLQLEIEWNGHREIEIFNVMIGVFLDLPGLHMKIELDIAGPVSCQLNARPSHKLCNGATKSAAV